MSIEVFRTRFYHHEGRLTMHSADRFRRTSKRTAGIDFQLRTRHHSINRFLLTIWFVLAAALPFLAQSSTVAEERLAQLSEQAQAAQQQGDYRTAARCYEEIVKTRPDVAEAWANLGMMYQFAQEYDKAVHSFQIALAKNPRLFAPNLFLGLNELRQRNAVMALHYLRAAESLNSNDEQAAMGMGRAYEASNDPANASVWFLRATGINPGDPDAWYGLGFSYLKLQDAAVLQLAKNAQTSPYARALVAESFVEQGRVADAISIYKSPLDSTTQPPCMLSALGFAYVQQGFADQARKAFEDELRKNPECLPARLGLARLAAANGDFAAVLEAVQPAWEADPNFVQVNVRKIWMGIDPEHLGAAVDWLRQQPFSQDGLAQFLAQSPGSADREPIEKEKSNHQSKEKISLAQSYESLWSSGHYNACEVNLQREKAPMSVERYLFLAKCSFFAGDYRTSLSASLAALKKDPQNVPALYWQAKSSQELAAEALEKMSAAAPNSAKVHLLLAELHRAREEYNAAEAEYSEALNSGSDDPTAHLGLAEVYHQQSEDDKALQQLSYVFRVDPGNPLGGFIMGQVLVRRHKYSEAIPYLQIALHGSPQSLSEVQALLARCHLAQGDYSLALRELKPALPSDTTGDLHYELYQIYKQLGDNKAASAALQESEKLRSEKAAAEVRHITANDPSKPE